MSAVVAITAYSAASVSPSARPRNDVTATSFRRDGSAIIGGDHESFPSLASRAPDGVICCFRQLGRDSGTRLCARNDVFWHLHGTDVALFPLAER